ncbi:MAG: ABC transporter permease [Sphaerobacter sp.]|nr:ABC transporter permease [Sphaerobacter sp.]
MGEIRQSITLRDTAEMPGALRGASSRTVWARAARHLARSTSGKIGLLLVALVLLMALAAPLIAPHDPYEQTVFRLYGPSLYFPFGTDEFGRDVMSRVIYGARISLQVGLIAVAIALVIGGLLGLVAGYFGGWVDSVISRVLDIVFAFPDILLALALLAVLGPELHNVMIAIGIVYMPSFARIVRGPVLSAKHNEYVEASRVIGAGTLRTLFRHILPNVTAPLIVQTTIALSFAILSEAALSFLGLGAQPPTPSWGAMLSGGRRFVEIAPWTAIFPGLAIMIAVLGFNLLGDWLRDVLDPRAVR